jgi:hypothetical protein
MIQKADLTERKSGKGGTLLRLRDGREVVVKDLMQRGTYNKPTRIGVGSPTDGLAFGVELDDIGFIIEKCEDCGARGDRDSIREHRASH